MRKSNKPLRRIIAALVAVVLLLVLVAITPLGRLLSTGAYATWQGIARLPGIAWLRGQMSEGSGLMPNPISVGGSSSLRQVLEAAEALEREEAWDRALERYGEALSLDEEHAPTHAALGRVLSRLGREDEAMEAMQTAVELEPDSAVVLWQLAQLHMQRDEPDEAVRALERARELAPDEALVRVSLGTAYYSRSISDAEKAVAELLRASDMQPEDAEIYFGLSMAYRNRLGEGDRERAIKALEKSLALDPEQPQAYTILGRSYLEAGDREAAIAIWRQLADRTDDPEVAEQIREGLRELEAAP